MTNHLKIKLLNHAEEHGALKFGTFQLNSKRETPYHWDYKFSTNARIIDLIGRTYVQEILERKIAFDTFISSGDKGLQYATSAATQVSRLYKNTLIETHTIHDEIKKSGKQQVVEKKISGQPLTDKKVIMIVEKLPEDINQCIKAIRVQGAVISAIIVLFDRQEWHYEETKTSLMQKIAKQNHVSIFGAIRRDDVINYVEANEKLKHHLAPLKLYKETYGIPEAPTSI